MESKFKRLTNAKVRDNSSRFESLLISAKRSPVIAGYGAAVNVRNGRAINSALSGKASFFRRNYSTSLPLRAPTQFATALSRLVKVKRFVSSNEALLPEYKALGLKYQLNPRSNSKSSVNKAESSSEISLGSIDPRFLRLRSPRSGQFMQRLFNSNRVRNVRRSTPNVLSRFSNVHRTNRRSVLKTTALSYNTFKLSLRKRQQLSFLLSNSSITRKQRQSTRYLYTSDARAVRRNNKFIIN